MRIEIVQLCEVTGINENDEVKKGPFFANRIVQYESNAETLLEAFKEYEDDDELEREVSCVDEFCGECIDVIKYLSISEVV